jgi:hypothetical protein
VTGAPEAAVREQADRLAAAWSGAEAPASWALTAALFSTLRDDPDLLALAARIDADRLPALLFAAAVMALVERERPQPLSLAVPAPGGRQPPLPPDFAAQLRAFCLGHGDELLALAAAHRYQMSEPARCAQLLPAVAEVAADARRPLALVDVGTGAGFALHIDAYRYRYRRPGGETLGVGPPDAPVTLSTELRGPRTPALPAAPLPVAARIGIDTEPLDVGDPEVRAWLRACTPPVAAALARFDRAADYAAAHPATWVRGDALTVLPRVVERLPDDAHLCLLDAYVHVFFTPEERARFRSLVAALGRGRDLDWISLDPLVPMGAPRESVLGAELPPGLLARAGRGGVFGVLGRLAFRGGEATTQVLALGHPGAAWLEWLGGPDEMIAP